MQILRMLAAFLSIGALSTSLAVAQDDGEYGFFKAEIDNVGAEWVVISYHFIHGEDCTTFGCIIIGPTEDKAACDEWASLYNRGNPFDHSRCVSAAGYEVPRYD